MLQKFNLHNDETYKNTVASNQKRSKFFSLSQKIVLLITLVVCVALVPTSVFTTIRVAKVIYDRISINAVSITTILCNSPEIHKGLMLANDLPDEEVDQMMQDYVNDVDNSDEASVAIFDKHHNLRVLYNPGKLENFRKSAQEIVQKYASDESISWQENYNMPNKALGFIKDKNNQTIGYVVTGYSDNIFNNSTMDSVLFLLFMTLIGLLIGIAGAMYLAQHIKKVLFGLEPEEIAALLQERNVLLNSVREGVIDVNNQGIITLANTEAKNLLAEASIADTEQLVGKKAKEVLNKINFDDIIKNGKVLSDAGTKIGNTVFIVTAVPLLLDKNILGAVVTFRKKSVVEEMANQLTGFKNYATALRAQTHEFMNKMHVIMGLIDMKAYDELKKYTQEIAYNRQSEVAYVVTRLKDITLAGFILGKISRSRELQIDFSLSDESEIHCDLEVPSVHDLVLIIGNIVENAFDVLKKFQGERIVNLTILDFDKEIVIVVEDSGPGMTEEVRENIFKRGYSSKGECHGFGLYLVKQSIDNLDGTITVESAPGEGTTFTVRLPIKKDGEAND